MPNSSILLARGTGVSVASGFSPIKIDYSDYPKSLISSLPENIAIRLFCCNHSCYCVNMVSVTSASRYITSASRYHPRYQSGPSMYIRGLIPRNIAELDEAVWYMRMFFILLNIALTFKRTSVNWSCITEVLLERYVCAM